MSRPSGGKFQVKLNHGNQVHVAKSTHSRPTPHHPLLPPNAPSSTAPAPRPAASAARPTPHHATVSARVSPAVAACGSLSLISFLQCPIHHSSVWLPAEWDGPHCRNGRWRRGGLPCQEARAPGHQDHRRPSPCAPQPSLPEPSRLPRCPAACPIALWHAICWVGPIPS